MPKSSRNIYCSVDCKNVVYKKFISKEVPCVICNMMFKQRCEDNKYCSKECRIEGQRLYAKQLRKKAILKLAEGKKPKCAICECPHIEALTIGYPSNDGKKHRSKTKSVIGWILRTDIEEVRKKVQLECAYCQFYFAWNGEYPPENKRPKWEI